MRRFIWFFFVVLSAVDSTSLGYIDNAAYNAFNQTLYNGTCNECICYAFFSNISSNYQALNCYKYNQTCLLFSNYSSKSQLYIDLNSRFIFKPNASSPTTYQTSVSSTTTRSSTTGTTQNPYKCGSMTILIGYDLLGYDFSFNSNLNYTQCCQWCLATTGCVAFTWGIPGFNFGNQCYLKNHIPGSSANSILISAHI